MPKRLLKKVASSRRVKKAVGKVKYSKAGKTVRKVSGKAYEKASREVKRAGLKTKKRLGKSKVGRAFSESSREMHSDLSQAFKHPVAKKQLLGIAKKRGIKGNSRQVKGRIHRDLNRAKRVVYRGAAGVGAAGVGGAGYGGYKVATRKRKKRK